MISDPLIKDIRLQLIYCDETGVNKITPTLQLLFHLLQPNAGGFVSRQKEVSSFKEC